VPKSARLDVWRLPGLRHPAVVVLGVHRGAFGEQELRSRDAAEGCCHCCHVQRRSASGGFFAETRLAASVEDDGAQRPMRRRGRTNVVGMRSSLPGQPTKER